MNLIQKIHGNDEHSHDGQPHTHQAPFWVRYYDTIVGVVTLGRARKIHQSTLQLAKLQPGEAILDIGCGTGKLIFAAEKVVGSAGTAVGLDVEPGMIAQAKANAAKANSRAAFGVASITEIPYPDNSFDVVTSSLVYHHLNQAEKVAGLQEVMRVLKPNGRFLIVDLNPTRRGLAVRLPGHNQLAQEDYVSREVVEQLAAAGFASITAGAHPFNQLSYALGVKMLRLIAKLHGIEPQETPDYGLDVPKLAKGTAVFGVLSSAVVIAHVVGFISTGMFLTLRSLTDLPLGELIMLTALSVLGILALLVSGFIFWSSKRGKFHMRDRVIAGLKLRGDEEVLDVGCGNGLLLIGAAQKLTTGTAVGVDIFDENLESHNSRESVLHNARLAGVANRVEVHNADARELPFEDASFDVVTSSLMLHHLNQADQKTAVQQMLRVLKPGGKLVIVEVVFVGRLQKLLRELGGTAVQRVPLGLPVYKQIVAIK